MDEIDAYIGRQPSPQKEICRELRKIILDTIPGAKEEMKEEPVQGRSGAVRWRGEVYAEYSDRLPET